MVEKASHT